MDKLDCRRTCRLVDAAMDGELDLLTSMAFDDHLAGCPSCAAIYGERAALVQTLRRDGERYMAPVDLAQRIVARLPAQPTAAPARPRLRWWAERGAWAASVAALAASLALFLVPRGQPDEFARELVAAHVRSLMPNHLMDVASTDQHTVKPWFNGRIALSPPVPDLAADGFPLAGGRLDYVDEHTAAALVYRRNQHVINLFVWAAPGAIAQGPHQEILNGYNLIRWTSDGLAYTAVSDLNLGELETFQRLWAKQATEAGVPAVKQP
jgi:anti-sigma factor RsiW